MNHYEFTIHLDREPSDDELDLLYEAGFADSSPEQGNGQGCIHVDRDALSLEGALMSAVEQARTAGFEVIAIDDEDLVGASTIATRLGKSRQYIHQLAAGKEGPGGFPIVENGDGWALYSWTQVARWARERLGMNIPEDERTRILATADHALRARAMTTATEREWAARLLTA